MSYIDCNAGREWSLFKLIKSRSIASSHYDISRRCLLISFGFLIYRLTFLALFSATKQKSEQWVAVSYGRDLRYIGRVVKEDDHNMTVIFLERRAGYFQLKRTQEEVEKRQVFMRDVVVNWKGVGRFEVPQEKELRKHHADFWKTSRLREKVQLI